MFFTRNLITPLALGAEFLGSGGGGSSQYETLLLDSLLQEQSVSVIPVEQIDKNALVLPVAYMGAPIVCLEQIPSPSNFLDLIAASKRIYGKQPDYLMPAEIGGANGLTALVGSCITNIPVVDADLLGRAYPRLEMASTNLVQIPPSPAILTDGMGKIVIIEADSPEQIESIARNVSIAFGSSALVSLYPLQGKDLVRGTIAGSITQAINIGESIRQARQSTKPLDVLLTQLPAVKLHGTGCITNSTTTLHEGFAKGTMYIKTEQQETFCIEYQNEYLFLTKNNLDIVSTPDIITILDAENLHPILSDQIQIGLRVTIISLPSPDCWYTKQGLALVGPKAFTRSNV